MATKAKLKLKLHYCDICGLSCSSAFQLCEHVVGHKHRNVAKRLVPESVPHLNRLQYFFDTYMSLEPAVGLEYVVETQAASGYRYRCLLCDFRGERKPTFSHITGVEHIERYLDKHHPEYLIPPGKRSQKPEFTKAMQFLATKVCQIHGGRKIKEIPVKEAPKGPNPPKTAKYTPNPHDDDDDFHSKWLLNHERRGGERQDFKGNGDFLEYLQKFEIRNDEDAWIVKRITRNCTQALLRFREEQALQSKTKLVASVHPPALARRTENELHHGASNVAPSPVPIPQNDAMQMFFDSLKNMEESEVVAMLQKIAATNPAFRAIDVPSVIRHLQATGRLKTSRGAS